jgi:RES domain-containing protein
MSRKPPRRLPSPRSRHPSAAGEPDLPSLLELERFSETSLHQWLSAKKALDGLHRSLYFELEPRRQLDEAQLLDALRSQALSAYSFEDWSRIVDYRYALEPLSVAGSLNGDGGRFNVGGALSPGAFTPFPALYVAEDYGTAFRERFGLSSNSKQGSLSTEELALRRPGSFVQVRLRGALEQVIDVGNLEALKPFTDLLKQYPLPKSVNQNARRLGVRPAWLIRSPITLQRQLMHPNWRMLPVQFDLPANSQIFGRLAAAAGLHGILYPSARQKGKRCLALFPQNWRGSGAFIEVSDPQPSVARLVRLDGRTSAYI